MFSFTKDDPSTKVTEASTTDFILFDEEQKRKPDFDRVFSDESSLSTTDGIVVFGPSPPGDYFLGWNTNLAGRLVNNLWFKRTLLLLIVTHSIVVAVSTMDRIADEPELSARFWLVRKIFLCIFTLETCVRLIRYRCDIFKSAWLCFDLCVITISWFQPQLLVLRTFRVLRSLRKATRFHNLREITLALGRAVPKTIAVLYLLFIIYYIFAVVFTSNYKRDFEEFRRLDVTFFTLFQVMTLDQWSELARRVMAESPWAWLPFCAFIVATTLFVVNFVVVIMIQALVLPRENPQDLLGGSSEDVLRLEGKIEYLLGMMEAVQQKQKHMDATMEWTLKTDSDKDNNSGTHLDATTVSTTKFDDEVSFDVLT